jgi:hypothetical protein
MEQYTLSKYSNLAYNAYRNTSFSPEKRRDTIIKECSEELDADLLTITDAADRERYKVGYEKHFTAWMGAKSRCASAAITGPANFPVARMEKANRTEAKRLDDFILWRKKALSAIERKAKKALEPAKDSKESITTEINGVSVVNNFDYDRLQLFFDGKPELEMITRLKRNGWKWSPTNKCWQRKLTDNARRDAQILLQSN